MTLCSDLIRGERQQHSEQMIPGRGEERNAKGKKAIFEKQMVQKQAFFDVNLNS